MRRRAVALVVAAAAIATVLAGVMPRWWWHADGTAFGLRDAEVCVDGKSCTSIAYTDVPPETDAWRRWVQIAALAWWLGVVVAGLLALATVLALARVRLPIVSAAKTAAIGALALAAMLVYVFATHPARGELVEATHMGVGFPLALTGAVLAAIAGALLAAADRYWKVAS